MIIFTSNVNIIPLVDNAIVYNLSSYYSGYMDITKLITRIAVNNTSGMPDNEFIYSPYFDNMYASSVLNNAELFNCIMQLMINVYNGVNSIVLVSHDNYRDAVTESIIKLIQVRYGYNCWEVETVEDLYCVKETPINPNGLLVLDNDKKQFNELCISGYIQMQIMNKE